MKDFAPTIRSLMHRLQSNPRIQLDACVFEYYAEKEQYLESLREIFERKHGFSVSEQDAQLLLLPAPVRFDIAWRMTGDVPNADLIGGEIGLLNPANSLGLTPTVPVPTDIQEEWAHRAYWFDAGPTYALYDPCTVLLYNAEQRQYAGLAIFAHKGDELLWLDLSWSEYLHAALTWHGAAYWPFLYLKLSYFQSLAPRWKALVAPLRRLLPKIFPEADWSIITAKQAYFDAAEAAEREIAGH